MSNHCLVNAAEPQIAGADHFFRAKGGEIVRWVKEFLDGALAR